MIPLLHVLTCIADANITPVVDNSVEFDASKPITSEALAAEQASDETLSDCRVMADAAKVVFIGVTICYIMLIRS